MQKKVFRVEGYFLKNNRKIKFRKEIVEVSKENALEKLYSIIGSQHKVKRTRIFIEKIEEISESEVQNTYIRQLLNLFKSG